MFILCYDNIIDIDESELSSANSAGGHDYRFSYINRSQKTIKYLYWNGTFYNAVNDKVYCDIRDYCNFTGKDTGPVVSGEYGGGLWGCVIYNWAASYVKLNKISIIYTDGTSITISKSIINELLSKPSISYNSVYNDAQVAAEKYNELIEKYKEILYNIDIVKGYLVENQLSRNYEFVPNDTENEFTNLFRKLNTISKQIKSLTNEIEKIEFILK